MSNQIPIFISVDPDVETDGILMNKEKNRAYVTFDKPLVIPESDEITLSLRTFSAYFSFPNLVGGTIKGEFSNDAGASWSDLFTTGSSEIALDTGLYDVYGLNAAIASKFTPAIVTEIETTTGVSSFVGGDIFKLNPNWATETIEVTSRLHEMAPASKRVRFTLSAPLKEMLGFSSPIVIKATEDAIHSGDSKAKFNTVNNLAIACDLINSSESSAVYNNNTGSSILSTINIDATPGKQIIMNSMIDTRVPISVKENRINSFRLEVLNENLQDILMTNKWSCLLVINY